MYSSTTGFDSLLEAVPDALVGMDSSGVIRFVNSQTEALFGYDRDDLVGQNIETLVPETLWPIYSAHHASYFADPRTRSSGLDLVLIGHQQNGTELPINISLSHIDTGDVLLVITAVSDVTNRKQAFQNAQRMTAIVEHSEDAILGVTLEGIITSWNSAAERMYGYSGTEIIGSSCGILVPEDRSDEFGAILARIQAGHSVEHHETVRVRRDGTSVLVSISVSPIHDEQGQIVGASTIARDVTERRKAFEAARAMIETSQDSLVSISADGRITDANAATVNATGISRDRLIGTDFSQCFTDPKMASEAYRRVFEQGVALADYPLTIRHVDGSLTDVLYNVSVHRGSAGDILAVFAAARDVTKLREAYEAARAMIESSLDSLVSISPEGRITDVNEATAKVTGVPREQLIGTAFSDYFTDPDRANEIYQRVFAEGMAVDYPLTMRHRDGSGTDVLYNASVYRAADGKVLGVFAAARDVTKQMRAQREVAAQQDREMGRLVELEQFQRLTVGRELTMIELKKEIEHLTSLLPEDPTEPGVRR
jgi:PAS domain S-box-containing protein